MAQAIALLGRRVASLAAEELLQQHRAGVTREDQERGLTHQVEEPLAAAEDLRVDALLIAAERGPQAARKRAPSIDICADVHRPLSRDRRAPHSRQAHTDP